MRAVDIMQISVHHNRRRFEIWLIEYCTWFLILLMVGWLTPNNAFESDYLRGDQTMKIFLASAPAPVYKAGSEAWERGESNAKARQQGWQPIYPSWREGFSTELGSLS